MIHSCIRRQRELALCENQRKLLTMGRPRKLPGLTPKQERFAQEFVTSGDATAAYRKVYDVTNMSPESIYGAAFRLKAKLGIRIKEIQEMDAKSYSMSRTDVIKQWIQIATADVNDLLKIKVRSCPKCYSDKIKEIPNADCPHCAGNGVNHVQITDTTTLKGAARLLYAGAKQVGNRVEILLRNQDEALLNVAKALGIFDKPEEPPAPISPQILKDLPNDPIEIAKMYQKIMKE